MSHIRLLFIVAVVCIGATGVVHALTAAEVVDMSNAKSRLFVEDMARAQGPRFVEAVYQHIKGILEGASHPETLPVGCLTISLDTFLNNWHFLPSWKPNAHQRVEFRWDALAQWWPQIKAQFEADGFRVESFSLLNGGEDPEAHVKVTERRHDDGRLHSVVTYCEGITGAAVQATGTHSGASSYCARRPHLTLCWN